jgi:hypothetical protein
MFSVLDMYNGCILVYIVGVGSSNERRVGLYDDLSA